jgi:hypothetical protein
MRPARSPADAPDPRTHTQIIEMSIDPAESPVTIDFTTATGSMLHVLDPERHDCSRDGERTMCLVRLPILEAQRSGRWTVTASKPDGPATAVAVPVRWEAVDTRDCATSRLSARPTRNAPCERPLAVQHRTDYSGRYVDSRWGVPLWALKEGSVASPTLGRHRIPIPRSAARRWQTADRHPG